MVSSSNNSSTPSSTSTTTTNSGSSNSASSGSDSGETKSLSPEHGIALEQAGKLSNAPETAKGIQAAVAASQAEHAMPFHLWSKQAGVALHDIQGFIKHVEQKFAGALMPASTWKKLSDEFHSKAVK